MIQVPQNHELFSSTKFVALFPKSSPKGKPYLAHLLTTTITVPKP
jgi:hypothetical protein